VTAGGGPGGGATFVAASGIAPSKKARLRTAPEILTSPDVQMLKLTSPQLAEFLTRNPSLATPTPSGGYQFPTTVTAEQELYVRGFEEALKNKHASAQQGSHAGSNTPAQILAIEKATAAFKQHQQQQQQASIPITSLPVTIQQQVLPTTIASSAVPTIAISSSVSTLSEPSSTNSRPSSSASGSYDDSASDYLPTVVVKQEPEADNTVGYAPPVGTAIRSTRGKARKQSSRGIGISPIDMESQEVIKLERKRLRNRLAASKCRKRKLERISNLDEKVADLKDENGELMAIVKRLKGSICNLKQEVMEHVQHGCQINMVVSQGST
jgi:transcription factor AP-1